MRVVVAIPAYNEEGIISATVKELRRFLADKPKDVSWTIVIADNGSDDRTGEIGRDLAREFADVRYLPVPERGKGMAIRDAWQSQEADVYVFMDADLSTDLRSLLPLVRAVADGADVAVGSRVHRDARVRRALPRRLISLGYRLFAKIVLRTVVSDLACGFKAVSPRVVRDILPRVIDRRWFFDSELVIRAERAGLKIAEIPVNWHEESVPGRRSKVSVFKVAGDYVRACFGLRRALAQEAPPEIRRERKYVLALTLAAVLLSSVPFVAGLIIAWWRGQVMTGTQFLSPGDTAVYFSQIAQAKAGHFFWENAFTTEPMTPMPYFFWWCVGQLARLLALSPFAAYHLSRILLIPCFVAAAYSFFRYIFRDARARLTGLTLFLFGSGVGPYFVFMFLGDTAHPERWPIDLWVGEANAFLTMMYSPHFVASFALLLLSMRWLLEAFERGSLRRATAAGLAAAALLSFHPFQAATLYAVPAAFLGLRALRRAWPRRGLAVFLLFACISAPLAAFQVAFPLLDPLWKKIADANVCITPPLVFLMIGFGAVSVLWPFGYARLYRQAGAAARSDFLFSWVIVGLLLVYLPFAFQRRLLEGLEFPLVVLSVPVIMAVAAKLRAALRPPAVYYLIVSVVVLVLFLPATLLTVVRGSVTYYKNQPPIFLVSKEEEAVMAWFRNASPKTAVVLTSSGWLDGRVAGWGERRVYVGHWVDTIDLKRKSQEVEKFFSLSDPADPLVFLRSAGITHVLAGSAAETGRFDALPFLRSMFSSGPYKVYEIDFGGHTE